MSWAKQRVPFLDDDDGAEENDVQDDVDSPVPTRPLVIDEDAEPAAGTSGGLEGGGGDDEDGEDGHALPDLDDDLLLQFEPMLPRVYDLLLPSLDARLNFVNAGQKYAAFLKYVHGDCATCSHGEILREKTQLLTAIVSKLMDINGILEGKDESAPGK
nr:UL51 [Human betaherpesvirus 5]